MTLSNLIRKGGLTQVATVTPATLATQETASTATVAEVATVAVADSPYPDIEQAPAGVLTNDLRQSLKACRTQRLAVSALNQDTRQRLINLARADTLELSLVEALCDADINGCSDLSDDVLRSYLRALADNLLREQGKRPPDETVVALCHYCGPVWIASKVAAVAPVINGFPQLIGCPWCHVQNRTVIPYPDIFLEFK